MRTIEVTVAMGLVGCKKSSTFEVEDDATDEEIEDIAREHMWEIVEWNWRDVDEKQSGQADVGMAMKIAATPDMAAVVKKLIEEKRITRSAYDYAVSQGYGDSDLIGGVVRVMQARDRIQRQCAPVRRVDTSYPSHEPTPEWKAKAGNGLGKATIKAGGERTDATVEVVRQYRLRNPIEQHADKFGMDMRTALERFMQDASYAMRIGVADLNRGGGFSSPGSRLGGLGGVPQAIRDGHARDRWVWGSLNPQMQATARALVLRELNKADGTPFSLEDFGAKMFPTVMDKNRRWGAAAGALWSLASELVFLYQRCPVRVRRIDDEERLLEAAG